MFNRIRSWLSPWPAGIPRLYPRLNPMETAEFLTDAAFRGIRRFHRVYVLPLVTMDCSAKECAFGMALSHQLIRNLMLLNDISIHGPEDTPSSYREEVPGLSGGREELFVTGCVSLEGGFSAELEVFRDGRRVRRSVVKSVDFGRFVFECTGSVAEMLGSRRQTTVPDAWEVGQPSSADMLIRYGKILRDLDRSQGRERTAAADRILRANSDWGLPVWAVDADQPGGRDWVMGALQRDPYDAQMCFISFLTAWKSQGPQPEAMQFCRRAIELSPGHGKAHMCAPHSAPDEANMLKHSELGYRLLKGNTFAINNYIINLCQTDVPAKKLVALANAGIASDPFDSSNYWRMIELFCRQKEWRAALSMARRLLKLFEPEMNERTLYCLRQNPERARKLDAGEYDPAEEAKQMIRSLKAKLQ